MLAVSGRISGYVKGHGISQVIQPPKKEMTATVMIPVLISRGIIREEGLKSITAVNAGRIVQ